MLYTNQLVMPSNLNPDNTPSADLSGMLMLKKMAKACLYGQLAACFLYFFCSLLFPKSHTIAVTLGVVAIFISLIPLFFVWKNKCFTLLLSCLSALNIAPIWFLYLEAVLPGYDAYLYSLPVYRMEAFYWISVFQIFINLCYLLLWKNASRISIQSFSFLKTIRLSSTFYFWITILAFAIPLTGFYLYYGSTDKLWLYLTAGRSEKGVEMIMQSVGKLGAFMNPLNWLFQLTPLFGSIAFVSAKNKLGFYSIVSVLCSIAVVFVYFLGGSRGIMLFVAAPAFFFLFYYNWQHGLKFWIPAILSLFLVIGAMELQVRFRGDILSVLMNPEKAAKEHDLKSITTFDPSKSHRDNNTYLLSLLIKGYPDKYKFEGFNSLYVTLVNPIPRAIWPGKPVMVGSQDLFYQPQWVLDGPLVMGTTSLTFSVVGEAYQSGGILGLLIYACIYGLFALFFDGITFYTKDKQPLAAGILGLGVFLSFWGYRSLFALVAFLYPIILLLVTISIIQKLRRL